MKKFLVVITLLFAYSANIQSQSIGIGTATPNASALLDLNSTSKGLLIPRMGPGQRSGILNPAKGLMVYDSTTASFWLYNGAIWDELQNVSTKEWAKSGTNIYNTNTGFTSIGRINPLTKLDVFDTLHSQVAMFTGGDDMWLTLAEKNIPRGYIGSYAGNPEDVDFGTYGSNATGKVHLTTVDVPRLTVAAGGNVGIGTTTPTQILELNGAIKIAGANASPSAGTIRYNTANKDFEGYDGSRWKSLTANNNNPAPQEFQNADANSNATDNLGYAVKTWADFVFVGCPNYDVAGSINQGAVKIYHRSILTNQYELFQTLVSTDGAAGDKFGFSLDATECLTDCPSLPDDGFGDIYLVVGAPNKNSNRGGIYLFRYDYNTDQFITVANNFSASDGTANDNYGYAISILQQGGYGSTKVLVGAPLKTVSGNFAQGRAYVVDLVGNFIAPCTSSILTGFAENTILNMKSNAPNCYFGSAVATGIKTVGVSSQNLLYAVGASFRNVNANTSQGVVYMFNWGGGYLGGIYDSIAVASDGNSLDYFGNAISIENDGTGLVAIAAYSKEMGSNVSQGAVYLFTDTMDLSGKRWYVQKNKFSAPDGNANDHFGSSLEWQGEILMIGSSNRDEGATDAGAVYVYQRIPYQPFGVRFKKKITDAIPQAGAMMGKCMSQTSTKYVFGLPDWDAPGKADAGKIVIGDIFY